MAADDPIRSLRARLERARGGPPFALAAGLDDVARWWGGRSARERVVLGLLTAAVVLVALAAGARRGLPGPPVEVLVASTAAPAGSPVAAVQAQRRPHPAEVVPDDALAPDEVVDADARLAVGLLGGEVLRRGHLRVAAPHELTGPDEVAVGVVVAPPVPPVGQRADLVDAAALPGGVRLAVAARVVAVDADRTWMAVRRDEAPAVVAAAAAGTLHAAWLPDG